ncbi:unnamed protein product [Aphanomyces euteiches]|uniref:Methyltransferase type 11 domain-containing protein n=1 Tax=Aphanomyces euteiches TaxID=100861 RepID=A0A6G0XSG5_9STRA|nr:hypothetical protein Ae201684_001688 [Aphanomyces euteiches]KAH9075518.1 hypothetical protein Ae201684P_004196 [Aphanomyces euteiches]KAH9154436.1 hypothetical protein AeRB84_003474 [Aphanomyces euteiches]
MPQGPDVHKIAKTGFVNGGLYDKARPDFPLECLDHVVPPTLSQTSRVLEIGSGTGKFTALLASRFDHITAVEPSEGMRAVFTGKFPSIPCLEGAAEGIPLPDASQDATYIAQAFHWCSNMDALTEMARVLVPNGLVALVWNMEDDRTPWVRSLRSLYEKFDGTIPQYRTGAWERVFHDQSLFEYPLKHFRVERTIAVDSIDQIWDRVHSKSYVQTIDESAVLKLKAEVYSILDSATFDRDADGRILYPYVTDIYLTHKL